MCSVKGFFLKKNVEANVYPSNSSSRAKKTKVAPNSMELIRISVNEILGFLKLK